MLRGKCKGITLVALVITIVILLILAGISISTLTNTGIFQKAKDAKGASENAEVKQNKILDEYETVLDQYDENTLVYKINNGIVKIGDYVSYTPDKANTDKILEELKMYSGSDANITLTPEIDKETRLKWRVLDVKDGKVRLISDRPTTSTITLSGAKGYNNAVYLLDKTCKTLYNNSKLASNVQNLKIEDIQEQLIYDYKQYPNSNVDTKKYGGTKEYTGEKSYPNIFAKEKKGWVDGIQGTELELSDQMKPINETKSVSKEKIKITQSYWKKTMISSDFINQIYYNLFIDDKNYWISSRCVIAGPYDAFFYVHIVRSGEIDAFGLYNTSCGEDSSAFSFRPVITLNTDVKLDTENLGKGSVEIPFNIK